MLTLARKRGKEAITTQAIAEHMGLPQGFEHTRVVDAYTPGDPVPATVQI